MTVRWRAQWTMSSTRAAPQRPAAALSPAAGPMTWMQVLPLWLRRRIPRFTSPRSMSIQIALFLMILIIFFLLLLLCCTVERHMTSSNTNGKSGIRPKQLGWHYLKYKSEIMLLQFSDSHSSFPFVLYFSPFFKSIWAAVLFIYYISSSNITFALHLSWMFGI